MIKKILLITALLLFFIAGIWLTRKYYTATEKKVAEQSQVLLEKIKSVCKLVTIEGHFSEVYNYEDYWGYDFSPFRKKALIRVKAKVSVGYDLEKMSIEALPEKKRIVLSELPDPTILSIDHELDYYDITEGTFNAFTAADYTKLNTNARQFILEKAQESDLLESAKKQGNQTLDMIQFMVENAGWTLSIKKPLVETDKVDELFN